MILINSSKDIICHACALMKFWTGLSKKELQDLIQKGAKLLVRATSLKLDAPKDNREYEVSEGGEEE